MNEHLFEHHGQTADLCPGLEDTLDRASSSHSLAPSKSSSALSARLRQQKSKVVSALKALTNSCKSCLLGHVLGYQLFS